MSKSPTRPLSPSERELMDILWDKGEAAAIELRDILSRSKPVARETVRTLLQRMEQKGWLKHRVVGRTHFFSPAVSQGATVGQQLVELLNTLCGGSPERLMTALLDHRGLSEDEAKRIELLIKQAGKSQPRRRK